MKTLFPILFMAIFCYNSLSAQNTSERIIIYRAWGTLNTEPFKTRGVLYELKDSAILVSNSLIIQDYRDLKFELKDLNIHNIETIKIRRHNSIRRGAWIGAATGFVLGGIIGVALEEPCDPNADMCFPYYAAGMLSTTMAAGGAAIGAFIGSFKVTIPINGSLNRYNENKDKLRKYSIIKY